MTTATNRALLSAAARRQHRLRLPPPLPLSSLSASAGFSPTMRRYVFVCRGGGKRNRRSSASSPVAFMASSSPLFSSFHESSFSQHAPLWTSASVNPRTFATGNRPKKSKKGSSNQKPDAYKQQLSVQQRQSSIIGKRPGQTTFSPPEEKNLPSTSSPKTTTMLSSDPKRGPVVKGRAEHKTNGPLVLPPSVSPTARPSSSDRDNRDQAHAQPSASAMVSGDVVTDGEEDRSPLRDLFLEQGIIPPAPRPPPPAGRRPRLTNEEKKELFLSESSSPSMIDAPAPNPSGVSSANAEDVLDLASMYDPSIHLPDKPDFNSRANRARYEAGTPLTDELIAYIGVRGPITVAEYMRRALRDGRHGYYTGKGGRDGAGRVGTKETEVDEGARVGAADGVEADALEMEDDNDWDLDDNNDVVIHSCNGDSAKHAGGEHVIGLGGDFVTAPEVSQLFGESILVWLMTQYQTLRSPSKIQIVEIGPGKGTLICDILRSAIETFPDFASALAAAGDVSEASMGGLKQHEERKKSVAVGVHLVEVTNGMRARQRESLRNLEKEKVFSDKRYSFRFADDDDGVFAEGGKKEVDRPSLALGGSKSTSMSSSNEEEKQQPQNTIHFSWHDVLSSVPTHDASGEPIPTFIICQELADALPIHSFQKIEGGVWRERLVDVAVRDEEEAWNATEEVRSAVLKRYASAESVDDAKPLSSSALSSSPSSSEEGSKKIPRLRFVLPPDTTPALRTLLRVDSRGKPIIDNDNPAIAQALDSLPVGSIVEACPEALLLAQNIASRIEKCRGAALVVDYGGDGSSGGDTLRGFWRHAQVHPLSRSGDVDVTADVDFGALREAVNWRVGLEQGLKQKTQQQERQQSAKSKFSNEAKKKAAMKVVEKNDTDDQPKVPQHGRPEAFGPISQGRFLAQMGIVQRVTRKIEDPTTTDEEAEELFLAMERLMAAEEMGERYKVLAMAAKKEGLFPPPGF